MVGPGGCFFRAEDKSLTLEPAQALLDLLSAGITLVLVSGRTRPQLIEACRIFDADGYIGELGSVIGWDHARQHEVLRGAMPSAYDGPPAVVVEESGVVQRLFERYPGRLEYHSPFHAGHEGDVMLRGLIDVVEAEAWLADSGYEWLRMSDNGVLPPRRPTSLLPEAIPAHVYHLMPAGLSKGLAVQRDLERRGLSRSEAVGIGDSASDLTMAPYVDRLWVTANGAGHEHMGELIAAHDNVRLCDQPLGLGWVQAVRDALTER